MKPVVVFPGDRFSRLVVLEQVESQHGFRRYLCRCDCETVLAVAAASLRSGNTRSCGCLKLDELRRRATTHGGTTRGLKHPLYDTWSHMRRRCRDATHPDYPNYGGRGITIDPCWDDFARFAADMGERPEGKTLDRIDNAGNYELGNCRWATMAEQSRNRRKPIKGGRRQRDALIRIATECDGLAAEIARAALT